MEKFKFFYKNVLTNVDACHIIKPSKKEKAINNFHKIPMIHRIKGKTYRVHRGEGNESLKNKRKDTVRYGTLYKGKSGKVHRMKWK